MPQYRPRLSEEEMNLIREYRGETTTNVNGNTALDLHLTERGIDKDDVVSVKHWQSASGEYRFSVVTKQNNELSLQEQFEPIIQEIKEYSPVFRKIERPIINDPHCLIIDPADLHLGKYASVEETGSYYNIEKAVSQVEEGIDGILAKSGGFNIDKIFFVIGNDVLHVDNPKRTTTSGTPQDTDGMWHEAFQAAKHMYLKAIEEMLPVADIHVIFNPSNHDYMSGYMLAQTIEGYYHKHPNVTFDIGISHRKYTKYGNSMIATSHGDGAKLEHMPQLMAFESPEMWAKSEYRYVYLHHVHHKIVAKDLIGVTIEHVRTPSPADSYHHKNGYVGAKKAIEGFIHSEKNGQVARITHHL